ncbi:MAG: TRAP transporter substrate-binding protein [Syntrophothermus sp.]
MKKVLLATIAVLLLLVLTMAPALAAAPEFKVKLGHMAPESSPYQQVAEKFKEIVEKETNGRVSIQIYHSGQLGFDRALLEAMQFGTLDFGVITSSPMSNFVPAFATLDLPYLFRDWDHVEKFLTSNVYKGLLKEADKAQLVALGLLPRGFRSVTNSKRPIRTPRDMAGLRLRVIESPIYVDSFNAMGASVQAMSWGEVFTALQQGAIDGQENAINTIYDERVYEVQKYLSLTEHMFAFATIVASKKTFDKFPADIQKILREAGLKAALEVGKQQRKEVEAYLKKLQDKGMVVNQADRPAFRKLVQPVYDKFEQKYGDKYSKAIEGLN